MKTLFEEIEKASKISRENRHRFITMLCTSETDSNVFKLSKKIFKNLGLYNQNSSGNSFKSNLIVGRTKFLEIASSYLEGTFLHYKDCLDVLGLTFSSLVIDFTEGFNPNDLGILVETISAGGMILLISPPLERWNSLVGSWEKGISDFNVVPGDEACELLTPLFNKHFISRTVESPAVIIYDVDKEKLLKNFEGISFFSERELELELPESGEVKKKLYKLCVTQDQVRVLRSFESYFDRKKDDVGKSIVITADRGRGKTAILGIVTPYLVSRMHRVLKRPIRVMVVAPTLVSVQTYFHFLRKAMVRQGLKDFKTRESNKLITVLNSKFARIEYTVPRRAIVEKEFADVVIVDEAAGMDPIILEKITEGKRYTILSSTIHGYEGTGRGILKFLNRFRHKTEIDVETIHLDEPIRYAEGDPVERWLYDILLLDSRPDELDSSDIEKVESNTTSALSFEELDKEALITDQSLLKSFFGIYVLAHYRNKPSDFMVLADFPNHFPFRITLNGKTICSLHVAVEGSLDEKTIGELSEGSRPKGQIIPDLILKHYCIDNFPRLKGLRVVRIAVHPSLVGKGIGSFALRELEKWAVERDFDWIGTVFGVNPELLNFWIKSSFFPAYISPKRNDVSGEYSVLCLRTISDDIGLEMDELNLEFNKRLIEFLSDELRDLDTSTAVRLLNFCRDISQVSVFSTTSNFIDSYIPAPILKEGDTIRMRKYFDGLNLYEYIPDIIRPLVRYFYLIADRPKLEEEEHQLLIGKCLQLKSWRELNWEYDIFKNAVRKIWEWYCEK